MKYQGWNAVYWCLRLTQGAQVIDGFSLTRSVRQPTLQQLPLFGVY